MQVTFLGTSSMVPTKERNHTSVLISYSGHGILLDCGEGTQRQLKIAGIKPTQITKVLISHWHGDHVLGLPGLIQTMGASEYTGTLEIYGPKGTKKRFEDMFKAFVFDRKLDLEIKEVSSGVFFKSKEFSLEALPLEHNIETLGYNFIEHDRRRIDVKAVKKLGIPEGPLLGKLQDNKSIEFKGKKISPKDTTYVVEGKKISFVADTAYCNNAVKLAKDADLMICEATYASKLQDKADEYQHLTAKQAGLIANEANAKKLVLMHFSARYKNTQEVEEDARVVFDNVICAEDFMKIKV
ncbi:ribonuclease Z [Nanoarchaeota archaeon]